MRALLLCCLFVLAAPVLAQRDYTAPADAERTDVWFDPTDSGWALTIAPSGAISSALLTDFDAAGAPRWWFGGAVRSGPGQVAMALYRPRWDVARQQLAGATLAGQLNFVRLSEDAARVVLQLDGRTREHALVRYVVNRDFSLGDRSGFWFDPADGGHGQLLVQQGRWVGSISLGYDRGGEPSWAFAQGDIGEGLLAATRVRRVCDPGCRLLFEAGGETRIRFRGQDDAIASITLADTQGAFWVRPDKALARYTEAPNTRPHPAALAQFSGAAALDHFVRENVLRNPSGDADGCIDFSAGPPSSTPGSDTNLQEVGVGEYDTIKRAGNFVYSLSARQGESPMLRVHRLDGELGSAQALHAYPLPAQSSAIGLHLLQQGATTRLILLSGRWPFNDGYSDWCYVYEPVDANVVATVFDVGTDGSLSESHRIELQGAFATSRLIGSSLLFTSGFSVGVDTEQRPLLPKWRLDAGPWQEMVTLDNVWLPNFAPNAYERTLTTLAQFNLDDLGSARFASVFARIDASYVAPGAWYLATTEYRHGFGIVPGNQASVVDIHKIGLADLDYRGSGSVAGGLYGASGERAFRFSEHAGDLRVITDHGWEWDATSLFELNVLREAPGYRLRSIATLPNSQRPQPIGPPHELAYGVRFDGEVAYAVSFYKVDPLYAIDLSDPTDPKLDSALEITGYSAYLHPLPGGFLLGVGKDAVPGNNGDGPGMAWFQGLKLSLFDQRDRAHPAESWRQIIGGRGSDSEVLRDHRAFASAATSDGGRRIAVPVVVHEGPATVYPWDYLPWTQTGIASFDVSASGAVSGYRLHAAITSGGAPRHFDARSVLLGSSVFLYSGGRWYGARVDATTPMTGPY